MISKVCQSAPRKRGGALAFGIAVLAVVGLVGGPVAWAHSPTVDANPKDWCIGAKSNRNPEAGGVNRVEDSGVTLNCGQCTADAGLACEIDTDCPTGTCNQNDSRTEIAYWDDNFDGAVNDLATFSMTTDPTNLYLIAELWVDPDPVSLPFGQIAIDVGPGGLGVWHDPKSVLKAPGNCSVSTGRACTTNADCSFCAISTEPFPSTRKRACGSGCNPDLPADVCNTSETCENLGKGGLKQELGAWGGPRIKADYLIVFDFSFWLSGLNSALLMVPNPAQPGTWTAAAPPFEPFVNPGASGGSGGPPGAVELAIPWSAFPGGAFDIDEFRMSMVIARGDFGLDFNPDGAIEDVLSEAMAQTTSTTNDSCSPTGTKDTTLCEMADRSTDAFYPKTPLAHELSAGGEVGALRMDKSGGDVKLDWTQSCSVADNDFAVYEGLIGSFGSHIPVVCSTSAMRTATFTPASGSSYYLVVPTAGALASEGSYGRTSGGAQRPASGAACAGQTLGSCP